MNIMKKVTLRQLKENKRRTLVTIIGVIISVAMIMAVATICVSFLDLFRREIIAENGEWHVRYVDVNKEQLEAVKKDGSAKNIFLTRDRGYAILEGSQNRNKPYIFLKEYDSQGYRNFPIELISGRMPKAPGEIVLSEDVLKNAKVEVEIGDVLELEVGQRVGLDGADGAILSQGTMLQMYDGELHEKLVVDEKAKFTVVGFVKRPTWEPAWAPGYTAIGYIDEDMVKDDVRVNAVVTLNKVKRSLFDHARNLAKINGISSVEFHNTLLRFYGVTENDNLHTTLYTLAGIIMGLIVVGSVSLIYNAFSISVSERSRYLGMLSSVGATKKQKRNSVFFEGIVIALVSIPVGILAGVLGIDVTFKLLGPILNNLVGSAEKLTVSVTPVSVLVACAVSLGTIFISVYIPAIKASRVSAIDAIRQTADIKLSRRGVKTPRLVRKVFGFEAEIGLKNLKRNKRRYKAIVFSLVISIVLFLTVSFFTENMKKSMELSQDGINFDISIVMGKADNSDVVKLAESLEMLEDVTKLSILKEAPLSLKILVPKDKLSNGLLDDVDKNPELLEDGKVPLYLRLFALDDVSFSEYASLAGVDFDVLGSSDDVNAIVVNTMKQHDMDEGKIIEVKAFENVIGEIFDVINFEYREELDDFVDNKLGKMKVATLTDLLPIGIFPAGLYNLNVIVSEEALNKLVSEEVADDVRSRILLNSDDPMKSQYEIEELVEGSNFFIYNVHQSRQEEENMIMMMSVFTYGFIALISAISIANILNTISTGIALRKREFAVLKSVGMTPKGFNKMLNYESVFYGVKALAYGLPISVGIMYLIYRSLMFSFSYDFELPWVSIVEVVVAVFVIVGTAMLYSSSKVKRENIIDALRQESL